MSRPHSGLNDDIKKRFCSHRLSPECGVRDAQWTPHTSLLRGADACHGQLKFSFGVLASPTRSGSLQNHQYPVSFLFPQFNPVLRTRCCDLCEGRGMDVVALGVGCPLGHYCLHPSLLKDWTEDRGLDPKNTPLLEPASPADGGTQKPSGASQTPSLGWLRLGQVNGEGPSVFGL